VERVPDPTYFEAAPSSAPAEWLMAAGWSFTYDVRSLLPVPFPRYARVFHPASYLGEDVRWATVAQANGRVMHPAAEWGSLTGSWQLTEVDGQWDEKPDAGEPPVSVLNALVRVLGTVTPSTKRCWFGVWEGYAGVAEQWGDAPVFGLPERRMFLLSGVLSSAEHRVADALWYPRPSLWWPDDHAWCIATDVDLMTTYVAGGTDLIGRLLAAGDLEALEVTARQRLTWDADTVNPLPNPPYRNVTESSD
jgi:hypothetical protein